MELPNIVEKITEFIVNKHLLFLNSHANKFWAGFSLLNYYDDWSVTYKYSNYTGLR